LAHFQFTPLYGLNLDVSLKIAKSNERRSERKRYVQYFGDFALDFTGITGLLLSKCFCMSHMFSMGEDVTDVLLYDILGELWYNDAGIKGIAEADSFFYRNRITDTYGYIF
jgi:hypothetical protein